MAASRRKAKLCLFGFCSSACFILALVAAGAFIGLMVFRQDDLDAIVQGQIDQMVPLLNGSLSTSKWVYPPAPVYIKYYFFNLTNPTEFENGAKPNFEEFGPFIYRENKTKFGIEWSANDTEVGYYLDATYRYDPSMSYANPKTFKITSINTVLVGLIHYIEVHFSGFGETVLAEIFELLTPLLDEYFVITHTVHEWVWGYEDQMLKDLDAVLVLVNDVLKLFNRHIAIPTDLVAFQTNASTNDSAGWSIVYTGKGNLSNIAMYKQWNNLTHISGWNGPEGGVILGGEGVLYNPQISRDQKLYAFISQLFRSGYFSYERDEAVFGIPVYRFVIPKEELLNSTLNPNNSKYWMDGPSGVLNLTAVFPLNAPVFASKPHFLDADPDFLSNVTGLHPNREKHDSFLDAEPMTGAVFKAAKRIQLNFLLKKDSHISDVKAIRGDTMFPVFYACEEGGLTEELANEFKEQVYLVDYIVVGGAVSAGVCFIILCLFGACCLCCCLGSHKKQCTRDFRMEQHLINDERKGLLS